MTSKHHKFKVNGIYLKFISYLCNGFEAVAYHTSSCCLCERASAVLLLENEATRFCLVYSNLENSNKSKTEYDGSRIYVGLPSHVFSYGNPEPEYRDVGYTGPRFVFIPNSIALVYRNICIG